MKPNFMNTTNSRRHFLKTTLATGALMPFAMRPLFAQGSGTSPNGKVNLACIGTPDFSHFPIAMLAMSLGKHVYVEKPMAHSFLNLGLPTEVVPTLEGHSRFVFPQASTLIFKFPARDGMPPVDLTWYDGRKNLPPLPQDFGDGVVDPDIPPPSTGAVKTKDMPPGKVIYGEDLTFKGGSHASTLSILESDKANDIKSKLPKVPRSPSNHKLANELLDGAPPRKEWEEFYKL